MGYPPHAPPPGHLHGPPHPGSHGPPPPGHGPPPPRPPLGDGVPPPRPAYGGAPPGYDLPPPGYPGGPAGPPPGDLRGQWEARGPPPGGPEAGAPPSSSRSHHHGGHRERGSHAAPAPERDFAKERPEAYKAFEKMAVQTSEGGGTGIGLINSMCQDRHVADFVECLKCWLRRKFGDPQTTRQPWRLQCLNLSKNSLSNESICKVMDCLKALDVRVENLLLAGNCVKESGVVAITEYVWNCKDALVELDLTDNEVFADPRAGPTPGSDTVSALLRCLYNHGSYPLTIERGRDGIKVLPLLLRMGGNFILSPEKLLKQIRSKGGKDHVRICASSEPYPHNGKEYLSVVLPDFLVQRQSGTPEAAPPAAAVATAPPPAAAPQPAQKVVPAGGVAKSAPAVPPSWTSGAAGGHKRARGSPERGERKRRRDRGAAAEHDPPPPQPQEPPPREREAAPRERRRRREEQAAAQAAGATAAAAGDAAGSSSRPAEPEAPAGQEPPQEAPESRKPRERRRRREAAAASSKAEETKDTSNAAGPAAATEAPEEPEAGPEDDDGIDYGGGEAEDGQSGGAKSPERWRPGAGGGGGGAASSASRSTSPRGAKARQRGKNTKAAAGGQAASPAPKQPTEADQKRLQEEVDEKLRNMPELTTLKEEGCRAMLSEFVVCLAVSRKSMTDIQVEVETFLGKHTSQFTDWFEQHLKGFWAGLGQ